MLVPSSRAQDIIHRPRHERFQSIRLHIWITGHGAQIFWYQDGQGSESGIDRSKGILRLVIPGVNNRCTRLHRCSKRRSWPVNVVKGLSIIRKRFAAGIRGKDLK